MTAEAAEAVPGLEQLLAEKWPDGLFGGRWERPRHSNGEPIRRDPLAHRHFAELAEAVGPVIPPRPRKRQP